MIARVTLVTGLILVVSALVFAALSVNSQQYTTSTSFITGTSYFTVFSYVTSTGVGTETEGLTFSPLVGCGEVGLASRFEASGVTHFYYSASDPMLLYVVDAGTLEQWASGPLGWIACAPSSGNWVRYSLGTGYDSSPLAGSFNLNLPTNTYYVVFVAPYSNPSATVVVGPVLIPKTGTVPHFVPTTYTIGSETVLAVPFTHTSSFTWIIVVVTVALVAALVLFLLRQGEHKPVKEDDKTKVY